MNSILLIRWTTLMAVLTTLLLSAAVQAATASDDVTVGRRIYVDGLLPDGQPLRGLRSDVGVITGRDAACVTCHRPSGLGTVEGNVVVPPVTGRALFGGGEPVVVRVDRRFDPGLSLPHVAYDDAAFAAAIRDGRQPGRAMDPLMPHYALSDQQLQAIAAYLKTLSTDWSPGVTSDTIRLATVIAPGVAAARRLAFLDTLLAVVNQNNLNVVSGLRQKMPIGERLLHSRRKLIVDVWELSGPSSTWGEQLDRHQRDRPVFAILSGLAQDEWQPVHDFCENKRVGCWFPSLDLVPAGAENGHYSLYFSAGVATEAEVIAHKLDATGGRIVQLVASDPVARGAAAALRRTLEGRLHGRDVRPIVDLEMRDGATAIDKTTAELGLRDTLILWLRAADLPGLAKLPPPAGAQVFVSATLAGGEQAELPMAWKPQALLVQPLELPHLRDANLERFDAWRVASKLLLVDRRMQSEVYFASRSLVSTLRGMLNNLHTDYLIERAEATLSMFEAMQLQDEIQAMMMSPVNKRPAATTPTDALTKAAMVTTANAQRDKLDEMKMRGGTSAYPRLSLAQGQRIASKGAYLERLNPDAPGIVGEPEWVVP
jgi:cytochrome c553